MDTVVPADLAVGASRGRALLTRLASAVVLLPVFLLIVVKAPNWMFTALVVLASFAASWELMRLLEHAGRPTYRWLGVIASVVVTASFGASRTNPFVLPALVLGIAVAMVLALPVWRGTATVEPTANTLLGLMYVGWLLGYAIVLHNTSSLGDELVIFVVGVTWIGETSAYLVGSAIGRHKLAPVVSPRKTVEGAVAQVVASVAAAAALGAWLLPMCATRGVLVGGALLGVVGQVGDLAESAIKRSAGTKDTGGLIPGHGGVLDRIDSLLFNLPAFYYFSVVAGCR